LTVLFRRKGWAADNHAEGREGGDFRRRGERKNVLGYNTFVRLEGRHFITGHAEKKNKDEKGRNDLNRCERRAALYCLTGKTPRRKITGKKKKSTKVNSADINIEGPQGKGGGGGDVRGNFFLPKGGCLEKGKIRPPERGE